MEEILKEVKRNIKSGRLRLIDLDWLVKTVEQQAEEIRDLRTSAKATPTKENVKP